MNKDNLTHMRNALDERRSDLAYNITQRAGAELVLHVLREDVWHWSKKDDFEDRLRQKIVEWYNEVWVDIATPRLVVRRGRCRAPRCCLPRDTPPGSAHTPQEPFSHAPLGQRARRRLHSGALAQAAGAEVSLRTPGLSHVVASPPALVCGHPSP